MSRFLFLTVDGLATGAVYALFALSLVLIWRAARIVNFAQGAISVAGAYVGASVGNRIGGWWLGLVLALVTGGLLGVGVERTALRRMSPGGRGGDRHLDAVMVALGVVMVIQAGLGMAFGVQYLAMPAPIGDRVLEIGGVPTLSPYRLLVLGAVALLVAGLALLFARTRLGLRLRAAAFAPEVAQISGVDVARMTTIGWGLSAAMGALAAMLVLPTGLGLHPTAMDGVFITAFTAVVLGGLDSAVGAVVGGLAVGLVLNYVTGYTHEPNLAPVAVLAVLLVALPLRHRRAAPEPAHPPPAALHGGHGRPRSLRVAASVALVGVVLGLAVTSVLPEHRVFAAAQFLAYLPAVAGLSVLLGRSGQLSIGHAGLMATGGYAMALTQNHLYDRGFTVAPPPGASGRFATAAEPVAAGWTLPVSLLAGVLAASAVGALLALAAARLRGPYLAGLTLAFGLVVVPVAVLVDALGGEQGLRVRTPRTPLAWLGEDRWRAWVALLAAALVLLLLATLVRGRLGRDMRAVRDDEVAAALCGIPVTRTRVVAFVLSAATAGLAGGVYVYLTSTVLPGYFSLTLSLSLVLAAVLGGAGSLAGAAWGTLFVVAVPIAAADAMDLADPGPAVAARLAGNAPLALFGLALIAVLVAAPGGVQAALTRPAAALAARMRMSRSTRPDHAGRRPHR